MERDRITLVCTTLGNRPELLQRMLDSAIGFDVIVVHDNSKTEHLSIPDAYNQLIEKVNTQWVCCMCDDDYFYPEGLSKMIAEVHEGIVAGVAHFKYHISGYCPKEDKRAWILGKEYDLCERSPITPKLLRKHGRMPAASFFRKSAWELAGGFKGSFEHDRDLWIRMAEAGVHFKYFDHLVYNFVRRDKSAWIRQNEEKSS